MKRFTETEKWRDPWFQKLDNETRTLWQWLCDRVDNAGVIDICWPICNAETNGTYSDESMALLGNKVEKLETGKWWIPGFVLFQFGKLSNLSKVHQSIDKLLVKHSLYHRVYHRVAPTLQEKEKEKDKEKEQEKTAPHGAIESLKPLGKPARTILPREWEFQQLWKKEWELFHAGQKCMWTFKDDGAVPVLLEIESDFQKIMEIARLAWGLDGKNEFEGKAAVRFSSFVSQFNSIRKAVGSLQSKKSYKPETTAHVRELEKQQYLERVKKEREESHG